MSKSASRSTLVEHTKENIDIVIFAIFFSYFIIKSFEYHPTTRTFPLVFLVLGLIFLVIEFTIDLLPQRYSRVMREITSGLTDDIDEEVMTEEDNVPTDESPADSDDGIWTLDFLKITSLLTLFLILIFVIGFLYASIVYVYLALYLMGDGGFIKATILAIFVTMIVYGVFGNVLNVPVTEGMIEFENLLVIGNWSNLAEVIY